MGLKNVGFAAVTNPATGFGSDWTHSGEDNLEHAKKAHEGLAKTIFKIIEKFQFSDEPRKMDNCLKAENKHLKI